MLHVQHLVEQHVRHGALRHARPVQAAIQQNVIGSGVIAAKLSTPAAMAPTDVRPLEFSLEIFGIQFPKHFLEVEVPPLRTCGTGTNTSSSHVMDASACAMRTGVFEIRSGERSRSLASINPRQQKRCSTLEYGKRRAQ